MGDAGDSYTVASRTSNSRNELGVIESPAIHLDCGACLLSLFAGSRCLRFSVQARRRSSHGQRPRVRLGSLPALVQMDTVRSSDNTPIGYSQTGTGPPLVLVHGTAGSAARWQGITPALAERTHLLRRRSTSANTSVAPATFTM